MDACIVGTGMNPYSVHPSHLKNYNGNGFVTSHLGHFRLKGFVLSVNWPPPIIFSITFLTVRQVRQMVSDESGGVAELGKKILAVRKEMHLAPRQAPSPQVTLIFKADLSTIGEKRIPSPHSSQSFLLAKPLSFHQIIKSNIVTVLCIYCTLYIYVCIDI